MVDFQLVSFSSIGRGQLKLQDYEHQRRVEDWYPVYNSANKIIGRLSIRVQYLYSFRQIYADEIAATHEQMKQCEEIVRNSQAKIDKLYMIFPSAEKPDLNWDSIMRVRRMIDNKGNTREAAWIFAAVGLTLALVAVNLFFTIMEPNLVELTGCLVLLVDLLAYEKVEHLWWAIWISVALVGKDIFYAFIYRWTDYTALMDRLEGGGTIIEVVRWSHMFAIALKAALVGCLFTLHSKDTANT